MAVQRLTKQERRASRAEDLLERMSVGRVHPTQKLVRRHPDGSVEVSSVDGKPAVQKFRGWRTADPDPIEEAHASG